MKISKMIDWLSKEQEIIEYVNKITKENELLKARVESLDNPQVLVLLPTNLRGKRYKDIVVPDWFQLDDETKLLTDLKHYLNSEVYPTRVIR